MEHHRARLETFTFAFLIAYAPIETWYSLPKLWDPFYLVGSIKIVLLILESCGCGAVGRRRRWGTAPRIRLDQRQLLARADRVSEVAAGGLRLRVG